MRFAVWPGASRAECAGMRLARYKSRAEIRKESDTDFARAWNKPKTKAFTFKINQKEKTLKKKSVALFVFFFLGTQKEYRVCGQPRLGGSGFFLTIQWGCMNLYAVGQTLIHLHVCTAVAGGHQVGGLPLNR